MSRIRRAFERRFFQLLAEFGARERGKGVDWLFGKGSAVSRSSNVSESEGLARVNAKLSRQLHTFQQRKGVPEQSREGVRLICDAGLGGLARWLRASGCETEWIPDIQDSDLVKKAEQSGATIITTDSFLLDRKLIVNGTIRALWVPPTLTMQQQLELVLAELGIRPEPSRCMKCGGELVEVSKEAVRERIPPRTLLWVEKYFQCNRCQKLYWHGTHWERIQGKLKEIDRPD